MMLKSREEVFRVEDVMIVPNSAFAGKTLKTSWVLDKEGFTVVAIKKGDAYIFNPPKEERLEIGDALILIGKTKSIREIKKLTG